MSIATTPSAEGLVKHKTWASYATSIYASRRGPLLGTVAFDELQELAKEKAANDGNPGPYGFVSGNAGSGLTYAANRREFEKWQIIPRMLRDATEIDLTISLFGKTYPTPVLVSPVGCQGIFHVDGELASARAAGALGIPFVMSTVASRSLEEIAAACGVGPRWFQLYWPATDEFTKSILERAKANKFSALVVTLDTMRLGWRPTDLSTAFIPMAHGYGSQLATSDPGFMARHGLEPMQDHGPFPYNPASTDAMYAAGDKTTKQRVDLALNFLQEVANGKFRTWEDIKFLRNNWDGPLVLKGIQCVDVRGCDDDSAVELKCAGQDALLAIKHCANGIIVSNHGGRQLDGAIASLAALDRICANKEVRGAQAKGFAVLFDSGIRAGSDVLKAMALGAQAVLVARPWVYGLYLAGQPGVDAVLRNLLADIEISLSLSGYASIEDIRGKRETFMTKVA